MPLESGVEPIVIGSIVLLCLATLVVGGTYLRRRHTGKIQRQGSINHQQLPTKINALLTSGEEVIITATQAWLLAPLRRDRVIVTSRRLILCQTKLFGRISFVDFLWQDIDDVKASTQFLSATIRVEGTRKQRNGECVPVTESLHGLQKMPALATYARAQELEQQWREKVRVRTMEEERARSGGIFLPQLSPPMNSPDPASSMSGSVEARLVRLKQLRDKDLISDAEYEAHKAQIINEL